MELAKCWVANCKTWMDVFLMSNSMRWQHSALSPPSLDGVVGDAPFQEAKRPEKMSLIMTNLEFECFKPIGWEKAQSIVTQKNHNEITTRITEERLCVSGSAPVSPHQAAPNI
ncbi:hypothetical protein DAPPUDRAFT_234609 [Daphnia pulex]|uniref:Uncharacterized protein n=1 Tax=Daphnia pulex TaxID=6669 RepID=E9FX10_DAPPU|nr:hypothetical protein DAPPUDRAFT_234609 [Daphnia pulex]|eukprot:EFX88341.1 hypothetical protein DAPPUDRAFT_234609 [Daphnia pulex]